MPLQSPYKNGRSDQISMSSKTKKKVNPDSINLLHPAQLKIPTTEKSLGNCGWEITNHMTHKDCMELQKFKTAQN